MAASPVEQCVELPLIEAIVGADAVQPWHALSSSQQDSIQAAIVPGSAIGGVCYPNSPDQLAAVVACAARHGWRMLVSGAGSKLSWGGLVQADLLVSTARLNRLVDHAIGDLTVTVEAGMRLADLQAVLAKAGQFLPIDPAFPERTTIGGMIATADTGSLRQRYNSVRDLLLGVSFVRSDGQLVKAGGRVVKNVAGYDLMKLLTGSYGTLGVLTQATFRVYPIPAASQTVILSGATPAIVQASQTILSSALTPVCADLLSASVSQVLQLGTQPALALRFQSIPASVQRQSQRSAQVGAALGLTTTVLTDSDDGELWNRVRDSLTTSTHPQAVMCKIGIRPSDAAAVLEAAHSHLGKTSVQIHAGSGLGRLLLEEPSIEVIEHVRSLCAAQAGFLSILQAPVALKQQVDIWGYRGNAIDLMQRLKTQFDPHTLLNPHRFVGGI